MTHHFAVCVPHEGRERRVVVGTVTSMPRNVTWKTKQTAQIPASNQLCAVFLFLFLHWISTHRLIGFKSMWTEQFKYQTPVKICVQCRWLTFRVDEEEGWDTRNTQQFCQVHVFLTEHVRFHSQTCTTQEVTMHFRQVHALTRYNNVLLSGPCISRWACLVLAGNLHNTVQLCQVHVLLIGHVWFCL